MKAATIACYETADEMGISCMYLTIAERTARLLNKTQRQRERLIRQQERKHARQAKAKPPAKVAKPAIAKRPCMYCLKLCRYGVCGDCWEQILKIKGSNEKAHQQMLKLHIAAHNRS
jgi:hypothetical protein